MNNKDILNNNKKNKINCEWENNINYNSSVISLNAVIILSAIFMVLNFFLGKREYSVYSIFWFSFFVKYLISYKYTQDRIKLVVIISSFIVFIYHLYMYIDLNFNLL